MAATALLLQNSTSNHVQQGEQQLGASSTKQAVMVAANTEKAGVRAGIVREWQQQLVVRYSPVDAWLTSNTGQTTNSPRLMMNAAAILSCCIYVDRAYLPGQPGPILHVTIST